MSEEREEEHQPPDEFSTGVINFSFAYMAVFLAIVVVILGFVEMDEDETDVWIAFGVLGTMFVLAYLLSALGKKKK